MKQYQILKPIAERVIGGAVKKVKNNLYRRKNRMSFEEMAERSYQEVLLNWQPGDDILFHSKGLGSYLIRIGTNSYWNHIGRVLGDDFIGEARSRVIRISLSAYRGKVIFGLVRMRNATTEEIEIANAFVEEQMGRKYDKWQLVGNGIALILNIRHVPNPFGKKYKFTCIELCAKSWAKVKRYYKKRIPISQQNPDDSYTSPDTDVIVDKPRGA